MGLMKIARLQAVNSLFEFAGTTLLNFDIVLKRGKEYYEET